MQEIDRKYAKKLCQDVQSALKQAYNTVVDIERCDMLMGSLSHILQRAAARKLGRILREARPVMQQIDALMRIVAPQIAREGELYAITQYNPDRLLSGSRVSYGSNAACTHLCGWIDRLLDRVDRLRALL